jgi:hypothetical protein
MRFIRGKRKIQQEDVYGFVRVKEVRAGVQGFYLVIGKRAWGWTWTLKKRK